MPYKIMDMRRVLAVFILGFSFVACQQEDEIDNLEVASEIERELCMEGYTGDTDRSNYCPSAD